MDWVCCNRPPGSSSYQLDDTVVGPAETGHQGRPSTCRKVDDEREDCRIHDGEGQPEDGPGDRVRPRGEELHRALLVEGGQRKALQGWVGVETVPSVNRHNLNGV